MPFPNIRVPSEEITDIKYSVVLPWFVMIMVFGALEEMTDAANWNDQELGPADDIAQAFINLIDDIRLSAEVQE